MATLRTDMFDKQALRMHREIQAARTLPETSGEGAHKTKMPTGGWPKAKVKPFHGRSRLAWAKVTATGSIESDTVRGTKKDVRDEFSIYDEESGAKARRVRITVVD